MKTRIISLSGALVFCELMAFGLSLVPAPIFAQPNVGIPERPVGVETAHEALGPDKTEAFDQRTAPQGTEIGTNTLYGENAGKSITTGESNTLIGSQAGYRNKVGWANTFIGRNAGYQTTSGGNTFVGYYAGYLNTVAEGNTFVGEHTGENNKEAGNSFFGSHAGYSNTTGPFNSFFGNGAGYMNTEGYDNSFFGYGAGRQNKKGFSNSCFGYNAGSNITDGWGNCYFGEAAGGSNEGSRNAFFGYRAGSGNQFGSGNIFLGYTAGSNEGGSNRLYIDNSDTPGPLIWGAFDIRKVVINGDFRAVATSSSSDGRWKKNIEPLASSLDKISSLQGVSYEWKREEYPNFGLTEGKQIGLVAQDVEQVLPELVSEDEDGYKSVSYTKLTAVLVEAVKELKAENQRQKDLLEKQKAEIEGLRSMIKESKSL